MILGYPRPPGVCRWKDDLTDDATRIGWDVTHLPAADIATDDVVRACKGADLLIWARTHGHTPTGDVAGMLRRVEDTGTATVGVHMDLYWGLPRQDRIDPGSDHYDPWWSCQHVFTADGGHQAEFAAAGVAHHWMLPAVGRTLLRRGTGRPPQRLRIVFTGSYSPRAHGEHRAQLLRWARETYGRGFEWWGYSTRTQVWGEALADLYATSTVVLGDSAPAAGRYWSDRVPTTLAAGGLLAHPTTAGLAEAGFDHQVLLGYPRGGFEVLRRSIARLTPRRRVEMIAAGQAVVAERHLWEHRLTDIARVVLR